MTHIYVLCAFSESLYQNECEKNLPNFDGRIVDVLDVRMCVVIGVRETKEHPSLISAIKLLEADHTLHIILVFWFVTMIY